jgi:hypothetical protein
MLAGQEVGGGRGGQDQHCHVSVTETLVISAFDDLGAVGGNGVSWCFMCGAGNVRKRGGCTEHCTFPLPPGQA